MLLVGTALSASAVARPGESDSRFGRGGTTNTSTPGDGADLGGLVRRPDGRLLALSGFGGGQAGVGSLLVSYKANGRLDRSFANRGRSIIRGRGASTDLVLQPDGFIATAATVGTGFGIFRYKSDGRVDASFGDGGGAVTSFPEGKATADHLTLQPDGGLVVAGLRQAVNPVTGQRFFSPGLARFRSDGTVDRGFGADGLVRVPFSAVGVDDQLAQPDGKVLIVTTDRPSTSDLRRSLVTVFRFQADGSPDESFGKGGRVRVPGARLTAGALARQPDGKILVAGTTEEGVSISRFRPDGSLDDTFGRAGTAQQVLRRPGDVIARSMALEPDGRILIGGTFIRQGNDFAIACFSARGVLDRCFGHRGVAITRFGPPSGRRLVTGTELLITPGGRAILAGADTDLPVFSLAAYRTR